MKVLLLQLDGRLPNLALMAIARHHRERGDDVELRQVRKVSSVCRNLFDDEPAVYASLIFERSRPVAEEVRRLYPDAVIGGTGWNYSTRLEHHGIDPLRVDYQDYPAFKSSMGFSQRGCRLECGFCVLSETLIVTASGLKPIADVTVGELVLTHKGRYRLVTAVMQRPYEGEIYRLRSGAVADLFPAWTTPEHPIWTRRISYRSGGQKLTSFSWKDAGDLRQGSKHRSRDTFVYPRTVQNDITLAAAPGADWLPINNHSMTLLGWYVAEGYISTTSLRGHHRITFCLGHTEEELEFAEQIKESAAALGMKASIYHPKIGIRVCMENVRMARWLVEQFGTGASTKKLPLWLRLLPTPLLAPFVDAWASGDGWHQIKRGISTWKVTTVSSHLACGLREIVLKMGQVATINRHHVPPTIQGREVNVKPSYTVIFHPQRTIKQSVVSDPQAVYADVQESEVVAYVGPVFNIEVEEDNSFCTPAFTLHNCVVPKKEGKVQEANTINGIWRGEPSPREIVLLDNDFFGQPRWRDRVREMIDGRFKVNFTQGINARMISDEAAEAIASVEYFDTQFKHRNLYTAWDNKGDEAVLFRGLNRLVAAGVRPTQIIVYMLIGYWAGETESDWLYRQQRLRDGGFFPYPMPFVRAGLALGFQRWCLRSADKKISWDEYKKIGCDSRNIPKPQRMPLFVEDC